MVQYKAISNEEIKEAFEHDPKRAMLMLLANLEGNDANEKANGKSHTAEPHDEGFSISIETDKGVVGLWSCWLKDKFQIYYPKTAAVDETFVADRLGMKLAKEIAPAPSNYFGQMASERRKGKGRIWASIEDCDCCQNHLHVFNPKQKTLQRAGYAKEGARTISIWSGLRADDVDAPTNEKEWLQLYRDDLVSLLLEIAKRAGEIKSVCVHFDFVVLVPEQLEREGFQEIEYLKGDPSREKTGFGDTVIAAKKGSEYLILESGNSMVPWVSYRWTQADESLSFEQLKKLLVF